MDAQEGKCSRLARHETPTKSGRKCGAVVPRTRLETPREHDPSVTMFGGLPSPEQTMSYFVRIPATSFVMGTDDGPENQRPAHRVRIDAFELAECQVTNAEYD